MLRLRATPIRHSLPTLVLGLLSSAAFLSAGQDPPPATVDPAPTPPPVANPYGRKYPPRVYKTVRLEGKPPVIDGRLDDEAWRLGEWSGGYRQQIPTEGAPPSKPTELKILFDDRNVYMAIRVHDDPEKVHRYPARRDDMVGDIVGICFDSYNDKRTGFEFDLTAGGGKIDLLLFGETEWDTTWDAVWDGKVAHDDKGWTAEFRVPLSQLRYGPQEEQVWGMHAWRWIARNQEEDDRGQQHNSANVELGPGERPQTARQPCQPVSPDPVRLVVETCQINQTSAGKGIARRDCAARPPRSPRR